MDFYLSKTLKTRTYFGKMTQISSEDALIYFDKLYFKIFYLTVFHLTTFSLLQMQAFNLAEKP